MHLYESLVHLKENENWILKFNILFSDIKALHLKGLMGISDIYFGGKVVELIKI
jgi:hypothetical protein